MNLRRALFFCFFLLVSASGMARAALPEVALAASNDHVYVAGRLVRFQGLQSAQGQPVVRASDDGLQALLALVGAHQQYEPGTRFVVITRADGKLVTFTVGSNAVSVDDGSMALPFAPFYSGDSLYIPLLAVAQALSLDVHPYPGGFAFSPQIVAVSRLVGKHRTIVQVQASAPLTWRARYGGTGKKPVLIVSFAGFSNGAQTKLTLGGREANEVIVAQSGPPGYPTTSLTINALHGVRFAAHRASEVGLDLVLARDGKDLALGSLPAIVPSVQITSTARPLPPPLPPPSAAHATAAPLPSPSPVISSLVPTAVPLPESSSSPGPSASPSPSPQESAPSPATGVQRITATTVTDASGVSRIALTLTGPVSFQWHRLADPDNRIWIDIYQAELVGPASDIAVKLPVIRDVKISQHELAPDHVVRLSIDPSAPVSITIGSIEGQPNQLGVDISANAPPANAPATGLGAFLGDTPTPWPFGRIATATNPRLIVIDPGHGGNDPGAMNQPIGLVESHLTLQIARLLQADLQHAGWRVSMTREGDYEVGDPNGDDRQELQARCDVANAAGARLFVSVHINASVSSDPSGITTYYWRQSDRSFAQAIQNSIVASTNAGDDGVKREDFYVIHHTQMNAVLVEAAYLSNEHDAQLLQQPAFLSRVAAGISQGIKDYTGGPPPQ